MAEGYRESVNFVGPVQDLVAGSITREQFEAQLPGAVQARTARLVGHVIEAGVPTVRQEFLGLAGYAGRRALSLLK